MTEQGDPAEPLFAAPEPRVERTPFGRLDEEHPLARAIADVGYPASTERVLASVRVDPRVDHEQRRWLSATLPPGAEFDGPDGVRRALGIWGPPPPTTPPGL